MSKNSKQLIEFRRRRKRFLIDLLGSRCHRCGYAACNQALQFHHADPEIKVFNVTGCRNTTSLVNQIEEVVKCWLLCGNCHSEINYVPKESDDIYHCHESVTEYHKVNRTVSKAKLEIIDNELKKKKGLAEGGKNRVSYRRVRDYCKTCNKELVKNYSSNKTGLCAKCYRVSTAKIVWTCSCILRKKLETMTYIGLARELGVSDNGIRRRLKAHPDCVCE